MSNANISSEGSPTPRKTSRFNVHEDLKIDTSAETLATVVGADTFRAIYSDSPPRLQSYYQLTSNTQGVKRPGSIIPEGLLPLTTSKLGNQGRAPARNAPLKVSHPPQSTKPPTMASSEVDNNLNIPVRGGDYDTSSRTSSGSIPITPASDRFVTTPTTDPDLETIQNPNSSEFIRLRKELEVTRSKLARVDQELHATRLTASTFNQALGTPSEADFPQHYKGDITEHTISKLQNALNASTRPVARQESWPLQDDARSEASEAIAMPAHQHRPSSGPRMDNYRGNQYLNEPTHFPLDRNNRGAIGGMNPPSRPNSAFDARYGGQYAHVPGMYPPINNPHAFAYQQPIGTMGTRLSPEAAEFSVDAMAPTPWNVQVNPVSNAGSGWMNPQEPMNYRRLLDRNMNCDWKYIVDKIVGNNDQQASIFLQQKLKVGTAEQKFEIVEAIIAQAYPLMVNRFGNFLVQRCFEHGTAEQVIAIANAIRGNTLTLSMDAFGCHVIQKAFDAVPEEYKAIMVHELLRRIPETVIHRYACHVWQKLFELRWSDSPPQIMKYVNEALRGMWHEVALGETGSLVVQNIFENCLEEDKRPCINEVLASIDVISHGQFGNWCIQHICEYGAPADRNRAIDHILRFATEYSMDQYASKVIEKCLKIGGNEFLDRYLERVCEGRADRPRMPLIDIAGDQFGNYLIQYILTHCGTQHREIVSNHVRKHMVSLRGSKYGSRVAMLCCNPAFTTRPGPPAGMQLNRYNSGTSNRGGSAYGAFRAN
ncbi:ARM repeat-containing protein [Lophium mytilinum]|uniref:ARM repeat-containing protein n=1 Tax=Lophium mytilinum TaxID=390894 RepID=A0A6A6QI07_9PEZI|nr:ARM repeat-containing protein [Lophium mytilinum]